MRNGKYAARRSSGTKVFSLMLAALLLVGCSVGATLAWLTATTNKVENTFTVGKVAIELKEHEYLESSNSLDANKTVNANTYKLIPGKNVPKDPFVTVKADSEKCWLFVRIDEANMAHGNSYAVKYSMANKGWTTLTLGEGYDDGVDVYYRIVDASASNQDFYVLDKDGECTDTTHENGCVTINADITSAVTTAPVLKFTAAAIQYDGLEAVDGGETGVDYEGQAAQAAFAKLPTDFTTTTNKNTVPPTPAPAT